jgi:hypothetical protein
MGCKMKITTTKQLVILMLLVVPSSLMRVTTTITRLAFAKSGCSRGQIDATRDTQKLHPGSSSSFTQTNSQTQRGDQGCMAVICSQRSSQAHAAGQSTSP